MSKIEYYDMIRNAKWEDSVKRAPSVYPRKNDENDDYDEYNNDNGNTDDDESSINDNNYNNDNHNNTIYNQVYCVKTNDEFRVFVFNYLHEKPTEMAIKDIGLGNKWMVKQNLRHV